VTDDPEQWRAVFHEVAASIADAVLVSSSTASDPTIRVQYANDAFRALTGYAVDDILGQQPGVLVGADTDLDVLRGIEASCSARVHLRRLVLYRQDGTSFRPWSTTPASPRHRRRADQYVSTYRDFADRAAAEAAVAWAGWAQARVERVRRHPWSTTTRHHLGLCRSPTGWATRSTRSSAPAASTSSTPTTWPSRSATSAGCSTKRSARRPSSTGSTTTAVTGASSA
jgi:PAS domain-containing protein